MASYTKQQIDDYLVQILDEMAKTLPGKENISISMNSVNINLKDFYSYQEIFGFYGRFANTDLFRISFRIPSCKEKVEDIPNVFLELEMNKKSNTEILSNHEKRNKFIKFLYENHTKEFLADAHTGEWKYTSNARPGTIRIYKRFGVKNNGLPSLETVLKSFQILASLDIPKELNKWQNIENTSSCRG